MRLVKMRLTEISYLTVLTVGVNFWRGIWKNILTSQESFSPLAYPAQINILGMCSTYPAFLYMSSHMVLLIIGKSTSWSTDGRGPPATEFQFMQIHFKCFYTEHFRNRRKAQISTVRVLYNKTNIELVDLTRLESRNCKIMNPRGLWWQRTVI